MPDAGRSECKFRQVSVTRIYLHTRHTTSLIKNFSSALCFKPLGGLRPPRGLNKKASEKNPLSITCWLRKDLVKGWRLPSEAFSWRLRKDLTGWRFQLDD